MSKDPEPVPLDVQTTVIHNAAWTHTLPFLSWIILMSLLSPPSGWSYAVRTAVGIAVFLYCAPWRWYHRMHLGNIPSALIMGSLVFLVWILPETGMVRNRAPGFYEAYLKFGFFPPWETMEFDLETPYAPYVCGWELTIVRLVGSAVVIALIEEFFWRGFLYRWISVSNFLKMDLGDFRFANYVVTALLFASVHNRILVALITGLIYGWYAVKTRDIWATALAHGWTNFLLGLFVVIQERYEFW